MQSEKPVIGILVLNRNGEEWISPLFESIRAQEYDQACVYLVDNASTDHSIELTLKNCPEVTVIHLPQNLGYCMAYNLAMPYAFADGCDWVVWANNDIRLEPGCLNELVRVVESAPKIGVVGPAFLEWDKDEPNYYILGNHPNAVPAMKGLGSQPMDVDWVEGSFLMVNRNCVEAVGPLDPYLFFYWEETDFCRRARYRGWRVVLAPGALARHHAGGWSQGNPENTLKKNWLQIRNYYIYYLANPFQGFSRNMLDTTHLFGVKVKEHLNNRSTALLFFETRVLLSVLRNLRTVFLKWQRDRAGGKPPLTTPDLESLKPEIIRNHARFQGKHALSLAAMRMAG